jgi:hypothetical protein
METTLIVLEHLWVRISVVCVFDKVWSMHTFFDNFETFIFRYINF